MMDHITPLDGTRRDEEAEGPRVFGVVVEWSNQGPILMESEGPFTSYDAAMKRCQRLSERRGVLRVAVVRLTLENGNELLLHDMERMQK